MIETMLIAMTASTSRSRPVRNAACSPTPRCPDSFGQQRRLHGLEEVERHPREQQPGEEAAGGVVLGVGGEELHDDRPRVHEREREHRAAQEQSDVAGELVPRRRRPGLEDALLAPDGEPAGERTA